MFSFSQPQQQQTGLFNNAQQTSINGYTRHSDLPQSMQNELEAVDKYINEQVKISDELNLSSQQHNQLCESIPIDVEVISTKLESTIQALIRDLTLAKLQNNDKDERITQLSIQMLDQLRTPGSKLMPADPLLSFFENLSIQLHQTMEFYAIQLNDIEQAIQGEINNLHETTNSTTADDLLNGLKNEYHIFMGMASRVAELHHAVEHINI